MSAINSELSKHRIVLQGWVEATGSSSLFSLCDKRISRLIEQLDLENLIRGFNIQTQFQQEQKITSAHREPNITIRTPDISLELQDKLLQFVQKVSNKQTEWDYRDCKKEIAKYLHEQFQISLEKDLGFLKTKEMILVILFSLLHNGGNKSTKKGIVQSKQSIAFLLTSEELWSNPKEKSAELGKLFHTLFSLTNQKPPAFLDNLFALIQSNVDLEKPVVSNYQCQQKTDLKNLIKFVYQLLNETIPFMERSVQQIFSKYAKVENSKKEIRSNANNHSLLSNLNMVHAQNSFHRSGMEKFRLQVKLLRQKLQSFFSVIQSSLAALKECSQVFETSDPSQVLMNLRDTVRKAYSLKTTVERQSDSIEGELESLLSMLRPSPAFFEALQISMAAFLYDLNSEIVKLSSKFSNDSILDVIKIIRLSMESEIKDRKESALKQLESLTKTTKSKVSDPKTVDQLLNCLSKLKNKIKQDLEKHNKEFSKNTYVLEISMFIIPIHGLFTTIDSSINSFDALSNFLTTNAYGTEQRSRSEIDYRKFVASMRVTTKTYWNGFGVSDETIESYLSDQELQINDVGEALDNLRYLTSLFYEPIQILAMRRNPSGDWREGIIDSDENEIQHDSSEIDLKDSAFNDEIETKERSSYKSKKKRKLQSTTTTTTSLLIKQVVKKIVPFKRPESVMSTPLKRVIAFATRAFNTDWIFDSTSNRYAKLSRQDLKRYDVMYALHSLTIALEMLPSLKGDQRAVLNDFIFHKLYLALERSLTGEVRSKSRTVNLIHSIQYLSEILKINFSTSCHSFDRYTIKTRYPYENSLNLDYTIKTPSLEVMVDAINLLAKSIFRFSAADGDLKEFEDKELARELKALLEKVEVETKENDHAVLTQKQTESLENVQKEMATLIEKIQKSYPDLRGKETIVHILSLLKAFSVASQMMRKLHKQRYFAIPFQIAVLKAQYALENMAISRAEGDWDLEIDPHHRLSAYSDFDLPLDKSQKVLLKEIDLQKAGEYPFESRAHTRLNICMSQLLTHAQAAVDVQEGWVSEAIPKSEEFYQFKSARDAAVNYMIDLSKLLTTLAEAHLLKK